MGNAIATVIGKDTRISIGGTSNQANVLGVYHSFVEDFDRSALYLFHHCGQHLHHC
jgi:hypothetical protein